jgi:WD40 repeat protein
MWSLDLSGNSLDTSCGFCIGTLAGHDNFIYTLAVLPNGDIVSGGEDRTVRVWHDGKFSLPTHLTHLTTLKSWPKPHDHRIRIPMPHQPQKQQMRIGGVSVYLNVLTTVSVYLTALPTHLDGLLDCSDAVELVDW